MNLTPLQKILDSFETVAAERKDLAAQLATIRRQRDEVIAGATGPNDKAALDKLNVLASQETIASNGLQLIDRKLAGLSPSALNEATVVRNGLLAEVLARRESTVAKLTKALSPFYPTPDAAEAAVAALSNRNQPLILRQIEKTLTALHGAGPHPGMTDVEFARTVLSAATRADAIGQ